MTTNSTTGAPGQPTERPLDALASKLNALRATDRVPQYWSLMGLVDRAKADAASQSALLDEARAVIQGLVEQAEANAGGARKMRSAVLIHSSPESHPYSVAVRFLSKLEG